ncbi:amino acid adenylation domain-containing protein [Paenibacillus kyungheensis]|uniref:Amino acid adenylation domain-containing protein n=1 Tax=Paenibacillus kyungheensis TaxID=1452732 RepID=A0AAX3M7X7_9BACL|nr:amino acid adenylation domain-containing protein [Paenibacillus kyungheensis]WCT58020.1 amino acid adenylation domain-containing protein [Paenibacillus kyungheensis]
MVNEKKLFPLIHPQKRIWYIEKIHPGLPLHNIGGLIWIEGEVDKTLLEEAIHLFIQNHEGIRSQITELEDGVFQSFEIHSRPEIHMLDFSKYENPKAAASVWAETEFGKPFELLEKPLFEFAIVKASKQLNGYFVKFHHLVSDGWSIQIMSEQIYQYYMKLKNGETVDHECRSGYADYILQEEKYLSQDRFEKNKRYWLDKFRTVPEIFLQRSANQLTGRRKTFWLNDSLSSAINEYVQTNRCSLNTFFISLVLLYQHKLTHQKDLIIGTPVLNRSGVKEKQIVGMFTSTLPFRMGIDSMESVSIFTRRVNKELMQSYYHQKFPYDLLIQELELRKKGYDQLFQISVNYYNTKLVREWEGHEMENEEFYCGHQIFPLQVVIKDWSETGRLEIKIDYQTNDYTDEDVNTLFERLVLLAEQMVRSAGQLKIAELELISDQERHKLIYKWNSTEAYYPKNLSVHQQIAQQAIETPEKIAAVWEGKSLTYAQLLDFSNKLAHRLVLEGIGKGSLVALLLNHSFETLIAILAVLKTGATYLPIDTTYPGKRIRYLLDDSQAAILICNIDVAEEIGYSGKQLRLDMDVLQRMPSEIEPLSFEVSPQDPAYIIYTSGSTGNPKGVIVTHQGLMNYTWWARKTYFTNERDVVALYSSLAFDLTVTSIFPPLIGGNTVAIYSAAEDEFVLDRIIEDNITTVLKLTPAHLSLIKHRENSHSAIRMLIVGGENLKAAVAAEVCRSFASRVTLINEYGPTETVVGCITHHFDPDIDVEGSVLIGRPIANTQVYVVDEQMQAVPVGVTGEIYIAGDGVANGYLGRSDLTEQRFIPNTFTGNGMMYKTDDLAFWHTDGNLEYIGRNDSQIKLNGYRIELGEIENQLIEIEGIDEAVVTARQIDKKITALAAYLVTSRKDITSYVVRQALLDKIPAYMLPQYMVFLDALPMTVNGKVDRRVLPDPDMVNVSVSEKVLNDRQQILLQIMKEILKSESISLQDNFYQLGGDSIKAIQVMSKLNEVGLSVQVKDILSFPILSELASIIEQSNSLTSRSIPVEGSIRPTPITDWFFTSDLVYPHHYNQSVLLSMKQKVTSEMIGLALRELESHHDSLRLHLVESTGRLHYIEKRSTVGIPLEVVDLDNFTSEEVEEIILNRSLTCKQSLHMIDGPLFKCILFHRSNEPDLLLLTAHHLIIDAVSLRILLEDLERTLQSKIAGESTSPQLVRTDSYQAWAEALAIYSHEKAIKELSYWQSIIHRIDTPLIVDYENKPSTINNTYTMQAELSENYTSMLLTEANQAYGTRPSELLVAALALACNAMSEKSSFTIELESHGREAISNDVNVSRTVGWFTSMYPVRLDIPNDPIGNQIKAFKEQLRAVPKQGIGYGALVLARKLPRFTARTIRFNYLGEIDDQLNASFFELANYATGYEQAAENRFEVLVDIVPYIQNKRFNMSVTYSSNDFLPSTIERFVQCYIEQLQGIIQHCCTKQEIEFTPSDFETTNLNQDELDSLFT